MKVIISAFRNIKNQVIETNDRITTISGNNMKGKTNTLNAIMWCLCGVDLNGSSDDLVNIPYGENLASVSVEIKGHTIKREVNLFNNKTTQSLCVDGESSTTLKVSESKIDHILGIDEICLKDTKDFKFRRFIFNPLYYRSVAPSALRNWVISVLFKDSESEIIENANLTETTKRIISNLLNEFGTLSASSKETKKQLTYYKDDIKRLEQIREYLHGFDNNSYDDIISNDIALSKNSLLVHNENKVCIDEAALELSKYYAKVFENNGIDIVLLEKGQADDVWFDVCYPKITNDNLPLQNGSTAEIIYCSISFVNLICSLLDVEQLPMLVDEGETLDKETTEKLSNNELIITRVSFEKEEGIKVW